jgi:CO/xanthine dehydrogenase FAD-binding subunit
MQVWQPETVDQALAMLAEPGAVAARAPLLARAVPDVAVVGVRRLATIGGKAGWEAGSLLPALLALDARVVATGGTVALADWLAEPAGVVLWVKVPAQGPGAWLWRRVGYRAAFSRAALVIAGSSGGARIAAGGGPGRPQRLTGVEAALATGAADAEVRVAVKQGLIAPDCAPRRGVWRRRVAGNAVVAGVPALAPCAASTGTTACGATAGGAALADG